MLGCGAMIFGIRVRTPKHPLGLFLLHPPKFLILGTWFILKLDFYDRSMDQNHGSFMHCWLAFKE